MGATGAVGIGLCAGWIVGPAAASRRGRPVVAALAGAVAAGAEAGLVGGTTAAVACAAAILIAAMAHVAWRRRLSRAVAP
jgi:hypothetical protein